MSAEVAAADTLAKTLSDYGIWGIVSMLALAVVYLFKAYQDLAKELRGSIQKNLDETVRVLASAEGVMRQVNVSLTEQKSVTENLKEIVRLLYARGRPEP